MDQVHTSSPPALSWPQRIRRGVVELGALFAVLAVIIGPATYLAQQQGAVTERFNTFDAKLTAVNKRLDDASEAVNKRFDAVDQRFDAVDKRLDAIDRRFEAVDRSLEEARKRDEDMIRALARIEAILGERLPARRAPR